MVVSGCVTTSASLDFDSYPLPRVDDPVEHLGRACFISTQYQVVPFWLHGALVRFQQLMNVILCPHWQFTAAYLDDLVIHSSIWVDHLHYLREVLVLRVLREALEGWPDSQPI